MDAYKIFRQMVEKEERTKQYKNYDKEELITELDEKNQQIERLEGIINELEIYIKGSDDCWDLQAVLDKLKELKGE